MKISRLPRRGALAGMLPHRCLFLLLVLGVSACEQAPRTDPAPAAGPTEVATTPVEAAEQLTIPPDVQAGDSVGPLEVVSAALAPAVGQEGSWVGDVQFAGAIEVTGEHRGHPSDPDIDAACFFPDSISALRLPRLSGDERTAWFCLRNPGSAGDARPPAGTTSTMLIGDYFYHFSFSDVFNTARLSSGPIPSEP